MAKSRHCQLPSVTTVAGRSSSITNAFFNAIIPVFEPTEEEELEALAILGMSPENIVCAYCGDLPTEWDHFRPIIRGQRPTGYVTEIANLVPSCGKCNQSKGGYDWKIWMMGPAKRSPKSRNIRDLKERINRLQQFERWRRPREINFEEIIGPTLWNQHIQNWEDVIKLLRKSQELASEIRKAVVEKSRAAGGAN
jgi:HNH endonuclease